MHNYPPAQMAKFGIDYNAFREINPRLVMCSLTPFGFGNDPSLWLWHK